MVEVNDSLDYTGGNPSSDYDLDYHALNAQLNLVKDGRIQFESDKEAVRQFFRQHANQNMVWFDGLRDKIDWLIENGYYEEDVIEQYRWEFVKDTFKRAYDYKFRFQSFLGAFKYYSSYALKTFDGKRYLERYEDRVAMTALYLARGNEEVATNTLDEMISGRFQPATPTFLNAGKAQRGELVSCFPAGTPVDTKSGQVAIEQLEVGDLVLSHDGHYHEIEKVIENENKQNLVSIKHYGHSKPIVSTPEHPVLVHTSRNVESIIDGDGADPAKGFFWLQAQDIEPGDFVVSTHPTEEVAPRTYDLLEFLPEGEFIDVDGTIQKPNIDRKQRRVSENSRSFNAVRRHVDETYDFGLILGWYLSEGYASKRKDSSSKTIINGVHFTLGTHETAFINQLAEAIEKVFGVEPRVVDSYYDGSTKISLHSRAVGELLHAIAGTGYNQKNLGYSTLSANLDFQRGILHGVFRGDGHTTNGALLLDLVNEELIDSLQLVLGRHNVLSRVRTYTNSAGNITSQLVVPGIPGENEEFIYAVNKNLENYTGLKGNGRNLKNSVFYKTVHGRIVFDVAENNVLQEKPEKVYNLHVKDTHTYSIRGMVVHNCFLLRIEDNMESIARAINSSLQLSKRGGGVALNLTNLREQGAPIKKIENQSSGIVPVMKMLEDAFSYANQLGSRQGAGAVYLNAHHPDILRLLDTKRENADEKVRIKTLSIGIVLPDITFELARKNKDMYLFSPYDVEKEYGKAFTEVSVTEEYDNMVDNANIRKTKISARELFMTIAELQFESGYPYLMFEDTVNRANPIDGRITMSNLCSEILQVSEPSTFNEDGSYDKVGKDISCNLGSLNIAKAFDSPDFEKTIESSVRALTSVSDLSNIASVPSIEAGNDKSHAIGLGQMNLHGFLAREEIFYDSEEAVDFTNIYFYTVAYYAIKASNKIAREQGESFEGFKRSTYYTGEYFEKYTAKDWSMPATEKVRELFKKSQMVIPTPADWKQLADDVREYGMYNQNLQAIPPTGSISYLNNSTSSIHPVAAPIEIRKDGKLGRVYYPAPHMTNENIHYYKDAYSLGYKAIINVYAAAQQHVDQGMSLTLFFNDTATTRDLNKAYIYAFRRNIKTLYYSRIQQKALDGTETDNNAGDFCESCML